ncbi:MAG TPA: multicopper oxidase domain-containing protein [Xanthomonadaceae bacterium]|jgi:FtsP/CotA-like multicopper oxidase with cupredoxin domain|nr:multicopper oxidase domain-containing protein [Xanthomonadaceae bacterium]
MAARDAASSNPMPLDRREFLKLGSLLALGTGASHMLRAAASLPAASILAGGKPDISMRIAQSRIELAPGRVVTTKSYNGQVPGPMLRLKQGRKFVVDVHNDTDVPEMLHWHGLPLSVDVDGAEEEGTPWIPARGMRRIAMTPQESGFRFYHTHQNAGSDLTKGLYGGLLGPMYIEPRHEPGAYDREVFLVLKEFDPYIAGDDGMDMDFLAPTGRDPALVKRALDVVDAAHVKSDWESYDVSFRTCSINGRMLGHGEPVRVKPGERVLFHILNGSAMLNRGLALPGHSFKVVALDGNPVPHPVEVPVLWIGVAERVSAIVEMKNPGTWVLGDLDDGDRGRGMGIVVEYAGHRGEPQWRKPPPFLWDYRRFADPHAKVVVPDQTLEMTFIEHPFHGKGFNTWTINDVAFDMDAMRPMFRLQRGARYRLRMHNASDDAHPIHLHRHTFEITRIAGRPTAGVRKDVAMIGGYQSMDIDFTADQPGLSLFHCHMQSHMDHGFMALLDCA